MSQDTNQCIASAELLDFIQGLTDHHRTEFISDHLCHCDACAMRCGQFDFQQLRIVHEIRKATTSPPIEWLAEYNEWVSLISPASQVLSSEVPPALVDTARSLADSTGNIDGIRAAEPPQVIGRYTIRRLIGRGGMGSVYEAFDDRLQRRVAIKFPHQLIQNDLVARKRFQLEARAAAAVHHPNVCGVLDSDEADGLCYLTMPLLTGQSLSRRLRDMPPLELAEIVRITIDLCRALDVVHAAGFTHRDIKPSNVFLQSNQVVTLMDFGIAVSDVSADRYTLVGELIGTPAYFAPEQARGDCDAIGPRTDIYAVGVLLFELLSGAPPFTGSPGEIIGKIQHTPLPSLSTRYPDCDHQLIAICRKALAKNPTDRYHSARSMADELDQWLSNHRALIAQKHSLISKPRPKVLRRAFILVSILAIALASLTFMNDGWKSPSTSPLNDDHDETSESPAKLTSKSSTSSQQVSTLANETLPPVANVNSTTTIDQTDQLDAVAFVSLLQRHRTQIILERDELFHNLNEKQSLGAIVRTYFNAEKGVLALMHEGPQASLWSLADRKRLLLLTLPKLDSTFALSPDASVLATAGGGWRVRLVNCSNSLEIASIPGHNNWINTIRFDRSGKWGASTSKDRTLRIFDLTTHQNLWNIDVGVWPRALAIANSGGQLATGCNDGNIKFWDAKGGNSLGNIVASRTAIVELFYSAQDKYLVSQDLQGEIVIHDLTSGQVNQRIKAQAGKPFVMAAGGDLLAYTVPSGSLVVYRISAGKAIWELPNTLDRLTWKPLGFTSDNSQLYSLASDSIVCSSELTK